MSAAPRFFTEGDEVTVSAIVQNYLESEKIVRVSLECRAWIWCRVRRATSTLPPRGSADRRLSRASVETGFGDSAWKALTDEESDAMELTLPVNPYGVKLSEAKSGIAGR